MTFNLIQGDLFNSKEGYFAHCISTDYNMSKGIAVDFDKKFKLRSRLKDYRGILIGDVILIDNVFNLITKKYYYNKPNYFSLEKSLRNMKTRCITNNVKVLNMPKIGCGLDKLNWNKVEEMIKDIFSDLDITINVYYI